MDIKFYTVQEVADLLGFHVNTIRRHIREGKLKATKLGREYRIEENDLKEYICPK